MDDVYVYRVPLPPSVHEAVMPCCDGGYTIYLNSHDCEDQQWKSYFHAMGHIRDCDFEKYQVDEIEKDQHQADRYLLPCFDVM